MIGDNKSFAVFKQVNASLLQGQKLFVEFDVFERSSETTDISRIKVYAIDVKPNTYNMTASNITEIETLYMDVDYAMNPTQASTYSTVLTLNQNVSDVFYLAIAGVSTGETNNVSIAASADTVNDSLRLICEEGDVCKSLSTTLDFAISVRTENNNETYTASYKDLADGKYYFHVKAKDIAGNFGHTRHYNVTIGTGGTSVAITSPPDDYLTNNATIDVDVAVGQNASVWLTVKHPDDSKYVDNATFPGTHTFNNVVLEPGVNEIYANATLPSGAVSRSSSINVIYVPVQPLANKTLIVSYSAGGTVQAPHLAYTSIGAATLGIMNEDPAAGTSSSPIAIGSSSTLHQTKIFMTESLSPGQISSLYSELAADEFLDQKVQIVGLDDTVASTIIAVMLRYPDMYISGTNDIGTGKYSLKLRNNGLLPDGSLNITLVRT